MIIRHSVRTISVLLLTLMLPVGQAVAKARAAGALKGSCPAGYQVKAGLNVDFPSDGKMRAFVVVPPAKLSKAVPKGTRAADFHLTPPPEGYSCKIGPYTDHY
jgi:hypothetical protein